MSSNLNITAATAEIEARLPSQEYALGIGNLQPFNDTNSGARKNMQITQKGQGMQLERTEPAIITTGSENQFGELSSSFIASDANYRVIDKVRKYSNHKAKFFSYWLILLDEEKGVLHAIERTDYRHITESYGYKFDNTYMDNLSIGEIVPRGKPVKKSSSFDSANNKCDGVNLTTIYMATALTTEDPIVISESAAKKFNAPLFAKVEPVINDNDILLNLYGDNDNYKTFPDIGEHVKNGILCGVRRERKEDEALYSQSWERLKDIMISDEKYTVKGTVIDINIYCNNPEKLQESIYNKQIAKYYNMNFEFCANFVAAVNPIIATGITMTYDMQKIYHTCKDVIDGKQHIKDGKVFNNIIMEIIVMEILPLQAGDKITDRYGGKGVVSRILPDAQMAKMKVRGVWEAVEAQYNSSTCVNRENPGQLFETSTTFIGTSILEKIADGVNSIPLQEAEGMIYKYMSLISVTQAEYYKATIMGLSETDRIRFINSMIDDGAIYMTIKPISESMCIDKLRLLYAAFPWIKLSEVLVPIVGSDGEFRHVIANRRLVTGKKYIYRLKQFAEEKFSAVSLASTNIRSENTKSKMSKLYKAVHASTPVRFGEMEVENLLHSNVETVIQAIMMLSTSPAARRLHEELLVGNPFEIDIKLDRDSVSRSVEIVNAYLKTAGLRLKFEKIPKKKSNTALRLVMSRIPLPLTPVLDRVPHFIPIAQISRLVDEINAVKHDLNHPLTVMSRVPSYIKTQEEANLYIKDRELSKGISELVDIIEPGMNTVEAVEKKIVGHSFTAKNTTVMSRWVMSRLADNFADLDKF